MQLKVRVFGGLAHRAGGSPLTVELADDATVGHLRTALGDQHPTLADYLPRTSIAVDLEVARDDRPLTPDAEVALLPPVAGGADEATTSPAVVTGLTHPPFDLEAVTAQVTRGSTGGTVSFLGTVRDHAPDLDDPVVTLEYSAYPEMAEKVLAEVADEVQRDHPELDGIALLHAVGELSVGDHTILIVCAAPHRAAAFGACRAALEAVKDRVPVFKREVTASGSARWVGLPDTGATMLHAGSTTLTADDPENET